ncbi:MAG: ribosome biogenesis factor YjgA [Pseudomonadota bacterium]
MTESDDNPAAEDELAADARASRSAAKRAAQALTALGVRLAELPADMLAALPLTDRLRDALAASRRIRSNGAKKRQRLFVGGLLRALDDSEVEAIEAALLSATAGDAASKRRHHALEHWRERLLGEADALTEFVAAHPGVDVQQLRAAIRRTQSARDDQSRRTGARALFRLLAEWVPEAD